MPLDQSTLGSNLSSFDSFKEALRPYIDIDGQDLIHRNIRDDQFEIIANINEAFQWPSEENWQLWRQALRQAFSYSPIPANTLKLLESENLSWVLGAPYFVHAPRQGVGPEGLVAYTRRQGNDSVQRSRLSRFLRREIGITDEYILRKLQNSIKLGNTIFELHTTAEAITQGFENCHITSCMKGHRGRSSLHRSWSLRDHPVTAYDHPSNDIVLITSKESSDSRRYNGRCLFNTRSKSAIRVYGNENFHNLIDAVGWNNISENDGDNSRTWGDMGWVRLAKREDENGAIIMPYLDGAVSFVVEDPIDTNTIRCLPDDLNVNYIPEDTLDIDPQMTRGYGEFNPNSSFRERSNNNISKWSEAEFIQTLQEMDEIADNNQRQFFTEWEEFNRVTSTEISSNYLENIIWNNPPVEEVHSCHRCNTSIRQREINDSNSLSFNHPYYGYTCFECTPSLEWILTHSVSDTALSFEYSIIYQALTNDIAPCISDIPPHEVERINNTLIPFINSDKYSTIVDTARSNDIFLQYAWIRDFIGYASTGTGFATAFPLFNEDITKLRNLVSPSDDNPILIRAYVMDYSREIQPHYLITSGLTKHYVDNPPRWTKVLGVDDHPNEIRQVDQYLYNEYCTEAKDIDGTHVYIPKGEALPIYKVVATNDELPLLIEKEEFYVTPEYLFKHPELFEVIQSPFNEDNEVISNGISQIFMQGSVPFAQPFNYFIEALKNNFALRYPYNRGFLDSDLIDQYIDFNAFDERYLSTIAFRDNLLFKINNHLRSQHNEENE